ncbi:hypothetical protein [Paenibacillus kobensis]|uniref:hypothetical protein n=1 Tax=Paenibacillus kobensis TaxID=59841 RepID=UPI000FD960B0|nr:hypothetical protein [Paenibacillus kobensis]
MDHHAANQLSDEALIMECFAPVIHAYKDVTSQDGDVPALYASFTDGQKALIAVQTFMMHAVRGTEEFHWQCMLFRTFPLRLQGIKSGIRLFGDTAMTEILDDIAALIEPLNFEEGTMLTAPEAQQLLRGNPDYAFAVTQLEARLHYALPYTYSLIASFIRNRADDFIQNN